MPLSHSGSACNDLQIRESDISLVLREIRKYTIQEAAEVFT